MISSSTVTLGAAQDELLRPLPVVSCDGHIGPRLVEDLRPYCPRKYLEEFDRFAAEHATDPKYKNLFNDDSEPAKLSQIRFMSHFVNLMKTAGHHDMHARLRDMDEDGITAEVLFPTTHNGQPEPFIASDLFLDPTRGDTELFAVGLHIFASYVADAIKIAPERFVGLVTPPLWDIEASVREVEWAANAGLRGVYLLSPRPGILRYDNPAWEPFWAACAANDMTLNVHIGGPMEGEVLGNHTFCMQEIEVCGWVARKAVHQMVFSGVFERHPTLRMILTEQNFDWWTSSMREFDSSYLTHSFQVRKVLPRKPSEYCASNVFIGASFIAPFEAEDAARNGYVDNVIWGRDYLHIEGTFQPTSDHDPNTNPTRLSLRYALAKQSPGDIRKIVSDNGIRFFGLDRKALTGIAERIRAPSLRELTTPIARIPDNGGIFAFRRVGAWG
jgi:predicted TIM-barrel fold metal-dependent hydrolase